MNKAYPLVRDLRGLRQTRFELLVIGGGIYGAWTAFDAALRGLKVALIEMRDWGSGTSSASSKLIHGGLRYLENFEFQLVRHALAERRVLTHVAPHLVRPLRFVVPIWADSRMSRAQLKAGLTLYDLLAGRNQPVPGHRYFSSRELKKQFPYLRGEGLRGGLSYGDCQEDDARMTLAVAAAAQGAGATLANRVRATRLLRDERGVHGAEVEDLENGERFPLHAACVVNAAGPWAQALNGDAAMPVRLVKGVHLVMPRIEGCDDAFLLTSPRDGRVYFVIPWYGRTLVGTTESEVDDPTQVRVEDADIDYLLESARHALPELGWTRQQVLGRFAGVRTLQAESEASLSKVTREFTIALPIPRLIVPIGGKYTTARVDSVGIVDLVVRQLGRARLASRTQETPLPGAPTGDFASWQAEAVRRLIARGVDEESATQAALRHGVRVDALMHLIDEQPPLAQRLVPSLPFIDAEVVIAARDEMARSIGDILRRRIPALLLGCCDDALAARVAGLMAGPLGWSEARQRKALDDFIAYARSR